jgi:hypothetical protein
VDIAAQTKDQADLKMSLHINNETGLPNFGIPLTISKTYSLTYRHSYIELLGKTNHISFAQKNHTAKMKLYD